MDADNYGVLEFDAIYKTYPQSEQKREDFVLCEKTKSYLGITSAKIKSELGIWQNAAKAFYMAKNKQSSFMSLTQFIDDFLINAAKDAGIYKVK
jgi:hypothetical protein